EDLQNIVITTQEGGIPIFMKDVAEVKIDGPITRRGAGSLNGKETVLGKVVKQPGTNTLEITRKILAVFKDLEKALPEGLKIRPEYVQADLIARAVANVKEALIEGAALVVIILMLFLYNFRTTVIALTAIPLSLILAVIVLYWYDLNINTMTLAGLAIAVGLVVDDAIIYVENIFRRLREYFFIDNDTGTRGHGDAEILGRGDTGTRGRGDDATSEDHRVSVSPRPRVVVLKASNEIVSGVVSATIIIILVFVPLITLEGIEGRLFAPLGIAVMVSMGASLLVAVTVTPVLGDLLLTRKNALNEKESPVVRGIKGMYQPLLKALMRHPKEVIMVTTLLIIGSILLIP
ncbi:MAG: efflux RND transporter permease subunit, partial [Nitrospira sp.]|nr:efflux RND transporter permease subunit [Nitrospira sp.]